MFSIFQFRHSPVLFVIFLLLSACSMDKVRSILSSQGPIQPLFEKTIHPKQNLVFRFSGPVVKPESIGIWDTTGYLQFSPAISGQFRWTAIDELVFSPDKAFSFATEYSVSPSKALIGKFPEAAHQETIRFSTPELRIEKGEAIWKKDASGQVWLVMHVSLNQAVIPDELVPGLEVFVEGKKVIAEPEAHFPSPVISLKIAGSEWASSAGNLKLKISLLPEKVDSKLKKWLKTRQEFKADLPPASQLIVYGLDVKYAENGENFLLLRLSQTLADSSLSGFVSVPGIENIAARPHSAGLEVRGTFPAGSGLELTLKKGLRGALGGVLAKDQTLGFQIGEQESAIQFASANAVYLPKTGNRLVALKLRSVSEISVQVLQIFPNNIIHRSKSYQAFPYDYLYGDETYGRQTLSDEFGTLIYSRNFKTHQLQRDGKNYLIPLSINPLPGQKGIFLVRVSDIEKRYIADQKIISITDLGLMAKQSREEIWVKCLTLSSNSPRQGTMITVIGRNNQPLYSGETNSAGEITIPLPKLSSFGTVPAMILAETRDDFSFLDFEQSRLETSRFPVDGVVPSVSGWQAVILSPRNLYEPGEKISMQVLLRDRNLSAIPDVPLIIKVFNPMGDATQVMKLNTGRFGQAMFDFFLPSYLATGSYEVRVFDLNGAFLASQTVHNESFDPIPLEITPQSVPDRIPFGKDWALGLQVENMFGLPAGKRPVQAGLTWENAPFEPADFSGFNFSIYPDQTEKPLLQAEGETDEKGRLTLSLPASGIPSGLGFIRVNARVQVFDEAQVPVYKTISTTMLTQKSLLGLRVPGQNLVFKKLNKLEIVSLNAEGKPVPGRAYLEIVRKTYNTVMEVSPVSVGNYRYVTREEFKNVVSQWVEIPNGKTTFPFLPLVSGEYDIRLKTDPAVKGYIQQSHYVYEGPEQMDNEDELSTEGNVEIFCDRKDLKPGDVARVRFACPFPGLLSICYEQNRIMKTTSLEIIGKEGFLEIPLTAEMAPNFYVSAFLTKPIHNTADHSPFTVACGYASIPVTLAEKELKTTISAPERSFSGEKIPVDISIGESEEAGIALAMVDEGILKITGYKMASPFQYFHKKKGLDVATFSMFGKIFSSVLPGKGMPGGDGQYMKAMSEMSNKQNVSSFLVSDNPGKKPLDGFSVVKSGKTKMYRAYLPVPAGFSGKIRLIAATFSGAKVGFAEHLITVADDITIKASVPEYLYPGDFFEGSVSFFNTGKKSVTFSPSLNISGISARKIDWPAQISLKQGEVSRMPFTLTAVQEGEVCVDLIASAGGRKNRFSKKFMVKPPKWIVRHEVSGELAAGRSASFLRPDFMSEKNLNATIELSQNPFTRFLPAIQDLLRYPYGCLEQTVSAAFPLIFMPSDWLESKKIQTDSPGEKWQKNAYLLDAIRKVSGLQLLTGGFSYWSGWPSHDYYSVYATHFLLEARQAGFAIDPLVMKKALDFTDRLARERYLCRYQGQAADGKRIKVEKLDPSVPYALYVLSLAGRPNRAALLQWKSQPERLTRPGLMILACALMEAGDAEGFNTLLPSVWEKSMPMLDRIKANTFDDFTGSDWVNTDLQEQAFVLAALAGVWPDHPMAKTLASRLNNQIMTGSDMMSTQELGMAVVALGKLIKNNSGKEKRFFARMENKELLRNEEGKKGLGPWSSPLVVKNENNKGSLYYFIQAQGFSSAAKSPDQDAGIQVRKTFFNSQGQALDPANLRINDLVVVKLSLKSSTGATVKQVVMADVVPSCLRIENKRLNFQSDYKLPAKPSEPDYLDIRRDRIHFFCSAEKEEKNYFYSARVISKGEYKWPPCEAQAMYLPSVFSRNGERKVLIAQRNLAQVAGR